MWFRLGQKQVKKKEKELHQAKFIQKVPNRHREPEMVFQRGLTLKTLTEPGTQRQKFWSELAVAAHKKLVEDIEAHQGSR